MGTQLVLKARQNLYHKLCQIAESFYTNPNYFLDRKIHSTDYAYTALVYKNKYSALFYNTLQTIQFPDDQNGQTPKCLHWTVIILFLNETTKPIY